MPMLAAAVLFFMAALAIAGVSGAVYHIIRVQDGRATAFALLALAAYATAELLRRAFQ